MAKIVAARLGERVGCPGSACALGSADAGQPSSAPGGGTMSGTASTDSRSWRRGTIASITFHLLQGELLTEIGDLEQHLHRGGQPRRVPGQARMTAGPLLVDGGLGLAEQLGHHQQIQQFQTVVDRPGLQVGDSRHQRGEPPPGVSAAATPGPVPTSRTGLGRPPGGAARARPGRGHPPPPRRSRPPGSAPSPGSGRSASTGPCASVRGPSTAPRQAARSRRGHSLTPLAVPLLPVKRLKPLVLAGAPDRGRRRPRCAGGGAR